MGYTVLARKWRPKSFSELVGQSHVMQALANALDQQRLHHAYLFTGTRGVGKTTIARIFAKALNCQEGISSTPCGVCDTCRSIDEGRFIDLIEVDAASKTKVDDTREILDNVQFAPTQGRYKVYLIDEVHMLSKSSFNALLKTLEEPPEHVKFLLATTDPHKLPITVLSRCLQFNLMRLTQPQIQGHLAFVLDQENIPYEYSALALIAKSADGSARDSLSLLDQAIAYGAGEVMFTPVQTMLGLVDQQFGIHILEALAHDDASALKDSMGEIAVMGIDYPALLAQLIESLHSISYFQVFNAIETQSLLPQEVVEGLAHALKPERVQMIYQIALLAKQDMQLAPDIRIGFEMALIRMLAFQSSSVGVVESEAENKSENEVTKMSQSASTQPSSSHSGLSPNSTANASDSSVNSSFRNENEMSPAEAMASLASARSLVGKKNAEINQPSSESGVLSSQNNSHANPQKMVEDSEHSQSIAGPNQAHQEMEAKEVAQETAHQNVQQAEQPDLQQTYLEAESVNYLAAKEQEQPESHPPQYMATEVPLDSPNLNSFPTHQDNSESSTTEAKTSTSALDHLSRIKAKLKQPLGNPQPISQVADESPAVNSVDENKRNFTSMDEMHGNPETANNVQNVRVESSNFDIQNTLTENIEHDRKNNQYLSEFAGSEKVNFVTEKDNQDAPPWLVENQNEAPLFQENSQQDSENSTEQGFVQKVEQRLEQRVEQKVVQIAERDESTTTVSPNTNNGIEEVPFNNEAYVFNSELEQDNSSINFEWTGDNTQDWEQLIKAIGVKGLAEDLARNSVLVNYSENVVSISFDPEQNFARPEMALQQITTALQDYFNEPIQLQVVQADQHMTPAKRDSQNQQDRLHSAQAAIQNDANVQQFSSLLNMQVIPSSIKPI